MRWRGEEVGHIEFKLHSTTMRATFHHTGRHARRFIVLLDGERIEATSPWGAWRELSRRMPRMIGARNL